MARLECSAVYQTQLQSLFQLALQLYRGGLAAKTCKHPSCTKFEFPMKNTVKRSNIVFNTPGLLPLPFLVRLMRLYLLQKSCAAFKLLLFLVTVRLSSYTSPASAKDLLDFHSPSFPLQILAVYLTSSLFKICPNVIQLKFNLLTARWCFVDQF